MDMEILVMNGLHLMEKRSGLICSSQKRNVFCMPADVKTGD
jgi:hypothetical protein